MLCVSQRRAGSGASLNRVGKKLRTSWQETDIDRAIAEAEGTEEAKHLKEIWKVWCVCVCVCARVCASMCVLVVVIWLY